MEGASKRPASSSPRSGSNRKRQNLLDIFNDDEREHVTQDEEVGKALEELPPVVDFNPRSIKMVVMTVLHISLERNHNISLKPINDVQVKKSVQEDEDFKRVVEQCYRSGSFKALRNHPALRKDTKVVEALVNLQMTGREAIVNSWSRKYIGKTPELFIELLHQYIDTDDDSTKPIYARFLTIVQSSGTGKSRLLDEVAKRILVIPMNLRPSDEDGFPAADFAVRDWLLFSRDSSGNLSAEKIALNILIRTRIFLIALFETATEYVTKIDKMLEAYSIRPSSGISSSHEKFRLLMTYGQTYDAQGVPRKDFYDRVIARAKALFHAGPPESSTKDGTDKEGESISSSLVAVSDDISAAEEGNESYARHVKIAARAAVNANSESLLILSFDEAHSMTAFPELYHGLRSAVRIVRHEPIFSVFLSTTGKIQDFHPPPWKEISARLTDKSLHLLPPFTELGFDQLAPKLLGRGVPLRTITEVASWAYMAKYGRPLFGTRFERENKITSFEDEVEIPQFAAVKIAGGKPGETTDDQELACIVIRLGIPFNSTTLFSQARERRQIERHLRICIRIDENIETAVTDAPSEPILAEGAYILMKGFNLPRSLLRELEVPGLDKGDRGEVICTALTILARDDVLKGRDLNSGPESKSTRESLDGPTNLPIRKDRAFLVTEFFESLLNKDCYERIKTSKPRFSSTMPVQPPLSEVDEDDEDGEDGEDDDNEVEEEKERKEPMERESTEKRDNGEESVDEEEAENEENAGPRLDERRFDESFKDAKMHFNHFIKIDDPTVISRAFLWKLIARGAAVLCAVNQEGVDVIIPFLYFDEVLRRQNVSAIFIQVKNDKRYGETPWLHLFDKMDPFHLGFFDDDENPVPIIRMVFALASDKHSAKAIEPPLSRQRRNVRTAKITTYDLWCAGTSHETFNIIKEDETDIYEKLLRICKVYPAAYDSSLPGLRENKQKMRPGTAFEAEHWDWAGYDEEIYGLNGVNPRGKKDKATKSNKRD